MKMPRKATTVGALMIAAGAITTGASITSQAMAAEDTVDDAPVSAVIIGSTSVDGDAYQCVYDEVDLPTFLAIDADDLAMAPTAVGAAGGDLAVEIEAGTEVAAIPIAGVDAGGVMVEVAPGEQGSVTVDGAGNVVMGEIVVGESGEFGEIGTEPIEIDPLEVRDGTPEECAALLNTTEASSAIPSAEATEAPAP